MGEIHWGGEVEYYFQKAREGVFVSYLSYPVQLYGQMVRDGFIPHNPLFSDEQKKKAVFDTFQKEKSKRKNFYVRSAS